VDYVTNIAVIGGQAVKNWSVIKTSTKAHPRTMRPHFILGPNFRAPRRETAGISKLAKDLPSSGMGPLEREASKQCKPRIAQGLN